MFALGYPGPFEIVIILVIALLLFGGKKLPELARGLAKSIKEFRKVTHEIESDLDISSDVENDASKKKPPHEV